MFPNTFEAEKLTGEYNTIPVYTEIYSDMITPVKVMKKLLKAGKHCFILESMADAENRGRYTFLGYNPKEELTCLNGTVKHTAEGRTQTYETDNPADFIRKILKENKAPKIKELPPFTGGLVGYFSYDFIKYGEPKLRKILDNCDNENGFNDFDLMLFDKIICFDNYKGKIIIICNIKTENLESNRKKAEKELKSIKELILNGKCANINPLRLKSDFTPLFSKDEYCRMVEKCKNYIFEGDVFQTVLSNRLSADAEGSLFDTYRVLRTSNPSPYMFFFSSEDIELAGSSPETLVKLKDGVLSTYPIAGTRPRGKTPKEDAALEKELMQDEKELSEHSMLVDLGRNDLGRLSKFGTVKVEKLMETVRYAYVMHIASEVSGVISENKDAVDAVSCVLPAGTLSGAPKIRACEIINELEQNNKRGIYGGAVGYLDFTGNCDCCISIRLAYKKNNKVFVRSGAGIVADSSPESEHNECLNKAAAVIKALKSANGGID